MTIFSIPLSVAFFSSTRPLTSLAVTCFCLLMLAVPAHASSNNAKKVVKGNVTLTTSLSNTHVLMPSTGLLHVAVDLKATSKAPSKRLPMNLALVIDRSGSMRGDKIQNTRDAARHLIRKLTDKDTLAIVSYSDAVRVDLPASRVTAEIKEQALNAISKIHAGGSTNLSGGLFRGQEEVQKNLTTGQVNRVILMSDGLANRGISDTRALSQQAQKVSQRGLSVTTMGVGADYNEDLMTALADHAGGNYYFVKESSAIAGVFQSELKKMFSTVAQGAEVELVLDDGIDLKQVFGYTFRREGEKVIVPLAEIFAGQKRALLFELQVPVGREGKIVVGTAGIRYVDIVGQASKEAKVDLFVTVTRDKQLVEKGRNRSVEERIGEVQVATAMTRAAELVQQGRVGDARTLIRNKAKGVAEQAKRMGGSKRLRRQAAELKKLDVLFDDAEASPAAAPAAVKSLKAYGHKLSR